MDQLLVTGGARLDGEVRVTGAKNSVLKLMAASLLAEGTTTITNCPEILDVPLMADVLRGLGCEVTLGSGTGSGTDSDGGTGSEGGTGSGTGGDGGTGSGAGNGGDGDQTGATAGTVTITTPAELSYRADFPAVGRLRASVCVLGPLMGRLHRATVALPGGDAIGSRPLDMHQNGLRALGASTRIEHGAVVGEATELRGARIDLDFPSVGATENILMAAVLARGSTVIENAAREPEISDLALMLCEMGARISGAGSPTIVIEGVESLTPTSHHTVGDRVVGGTWAFAAAVTRGRVRVHGVDPHHLTVPLERLAQAGAAVDRFDDGFLVEMSGRPHAVDFVTLPYPSFPTDLQPMALAMAAVADGHSMITENVFDARFRFVEELIRMGADATIDGHHASIRGRDQLSSAPVWATDIRAGAGLVLAGLAADGVTSVHDVFHIDRGYPHFVPDLVALGARVQRVPED